ncbi:MAG: CoA-binding protein [Deltaproteobacteria bacterium]|nr:CoA-binding protein [Deltaproteobacteria bacterium]
MNHFMEPRSVAIIGISRRSGPGSYNLMENMLHYGFKGKIFPVNLEAREILGFQAYPSIGEVGQQVDLAIITLPRELVVQQVKECVASGVKAVIVVGQGFADADDRGKALQHEMVSIAKKNGMRILGPNTLGVVNNFHHFTTSFMPLHKEKAPIGMICQSGLFFVGARNFTEKIGKGIDIGNACDIGFADCLAYLGEDPDIEIITVHMEGLEHPKEFLSLASRVAREKPIIVFKTGQSAAGARAAASHSGSMAGHYDIYRVALKQAGLLFLENDGRMRDAVRTLLSQPLLQGKRIAVITITGAGGIVASDALERNGLELARLSGETIGTLARLSPEWMPLGNPLDIWPAVMNHEMQEVYGQALEAVLADPGVDGVLCISVALDMEKFGFLDVSECLNRAASKEQQKPVVAWLYGPGKEEIGAKLEERKRISAYGTIEAAAWSLSILRERQQFLEKTPVP